MAKKKSPLKLTDLSGADYNPRKISPENAIALGDSIDEFGDLSGITYNATTGNLVTGHQRVEQLYTLYGDLSFKDGYVITPKGEKFTVRIVEWERAKEIAANLAANSPSLQGEFTTKLTSLLDEIKLELPDYFDKLRFDELYAVPITFDVPDAFGGEELRGSFSGNIAGNSPYGSITILVKRKDVEMVKNTVKDLGKDKFAAAFVKMCRGLNA